MKRLLPTLLKLQVTSYKLLHARKKGFTLIELMVVVAIIAVLSLVALGAFTGVQGSARDARRIAEIDALSKNIESSRDPQTGYYQYTTAMMLKDYPDGLKDPDGRKYCADAAASTTPTTPTTSWSGSDNCPTDWEAIGGAASDTTLVYATAGENNDLTDGVGGTSKVGNKTWKVCASLERSAPYCKRNTLNR